MSIQIKIPLPFWGGGFLLLERGNTGITALEKNATLWPGLSLSHITMSSDGCSSLPQFDENGNILQLNTGSLVTMLDELRDAVIMENLAIEAALQTVTSNVAGILKLPAKGHVAMGKDADLVLIDPEFRILHLCAMGVLMIRDGRLLRKGYYEGP